MLALDTEEYLYKEWIIGDNYSSELSYLYSDGKDIWIATTTNFYSYNINTEEKKYYSESIRKFGR